MSGQTNGSVDQIRRFSILELGANVVELQVVQTDYRPKSG